MGRRVIGIDIFSFGLTATHSQMLRFAPNF